ncbi:hypothetical protein F2P81_014566 [Scophthalmus maximus]|uniref:Uncharacterized protein n=1 Tax=Scophthalmus maximus TaxID=52904 RepID=A0A6A4SAQ3_SCOMX|nr:hypothetical protein F2P81_014566 [Scophthalmus maximus]
MATDEGEKCFTAQLCDCYDDIIRVLADSALHVDTLRMHRYNSKMEKVSERYIVNSSSANKSAGKTSTTGGKESVISLKTRCHLMIVSVEKTGLCLHSTRLLSEVKGGAPEDTDLFILRGKADHRLFRWTLENHQHSTFSKDIR